MLCMTPNGKIIYKDGIEVDFVFVYEVKKRELQGIALIGYELLRKGYTVGYVNTWHELDRINKKKYRAKIAIVFEAYNTSVVNFALSFIESCDNIVNMQWEQVLNENCLRKGSVYLLEGKANSVYHFSWGEKNKKHLEEVCKIPSKYVKMVGHVGLDFARKEFQTFYKDREKICRQYKIKMKNEIFTFISSFSTIGKKNGTDEGWSKFKLKNQIEIINWMKRYAETHKNVTVIYRPHPTECITRELRDLCGKNLKIIKSETVQQWIIISDVILNWCSTSMADIYAAQKPCIVMRPFEMLHEHEYFAFQTAKKVVSYAEFLDVIDGKIEFPISKDIMEQYYYFDENEYCYQKIVSLLENLYNSSNKLEKDFFEKFSDDDSRLIKNIRLVYGYYRAVILKLMDNNKTNKQEYFEVIYHHVMDKENYVSEKRIILLLEKINRLKLMI